MKNILIIGAASAIARETAILFAKDGASLFLVDINDRTYCMMHGKTVTVSIQTAIITIRALESQI